MVFTNDGRRNEDLTRIGKVNAVLRELYRSVVTKRELSNTAKLSVFISVFVPILTCGHESWVMIERILSQVQAAEMGFLRRVHGMTLCDKVRNCEICKALNVEPRFGIERSQIRRSATSPECPTKGWQFRVLLGLLLRDPPQRNSGHENEWIFAYSTLACGFISTVISP